MVILADSCKTENTFLPCCLYSTRNKIQSLLSHFPHTHKFLLWTKMPLIALSSASQGHSPIQLHLVNSCGTEKPNCFLSWDRQVQKYRRVESSLLGNKLSVPDLFISRTFLASPFLSESLLGISLIEITLWIISAIISRISAFPFVLMFLLFTDTIDGKNNYKHRPGLLFFCKGPHY